VSRPADRAQRRAGRWLAGALAASVLWLSPPALALRLTPFVVEFAPKGPDANRLFRVENETGEPAAVQVSMVRREMDDNGHERLVDAEDDFTVFPPQLILGPGESKTVRVQWLGDPQPKAELTYRIIVEQLPVELEPARPGGRLKLVLRYEGSVYIVPSGARAHVAVAAVSELSGPNGASQLAVDILNDGTAHAVLSDAKLTLKTSAGGATTLSGDALKGLDGENVLAGHHRRFTLPWPTGLPHGRLDATIDYRAGP